MWWFCCFLVFEIKTPIFRLRLSAVLCCGWCTKDSLLGWQEEEDGAWRTTPRPSIPLSGSWWSVVKIITITTTMMMMVIIWSSQPHSSNPAHDGQGGTSTRIHVRPLPLLLLPLFGSCWSSRGWRWRWSEWPKTSIPSYITQYQDHDGKEDWRRNLDHRDQQKGWRSTTRKGDGAKVNI